MSAPRPNRPDDFAGLNRREFLAASGTGLLAAAIPGATQLASAAEPASAENLATSNPQASTGNKKKIPIGVFDPVYSALSLDAMLDKVSALGLEAMEIGTGGYPGSSHCPIDEIYNDSAKAKAWVKKFDDRGIRVATLSCHGNPVHPDAQHAARDAETFRKTVQLAEKIGVQVIVGFSGCPGGSPADTQPNWITYRWPEEYDQMLQWQWKEKVVPLLERSGEICPRTWHPSLGV
jgi:Xylose isomerase-like TIM barrel